MKDYDEKADIWSLGCVFYEMLVGSTPYKGKYFSALPKFIN
jgi:serine/threonine protein kinase